MSAERIDPVVAMIAEELRRGPPGAEREMAKARVMEMVRATGPHTPQARTAREVREARWPRLAGRGLSPTIGFALAAGFAAMVLLRAPTSPAASSDLRRGPAEGGWPAAMTAVVLRDTLRLVRFMLVAPGAGRVALAGDFNDWDARSTQLAESAGVWRVELALRRGDHRYAFVVDDTQWVSDHSSRASGRPASLVRVE